MKLLQYVAVTAGALALADGARLRDGIATRLAEKMDSDALLAAVEEREISNIESFLHGADMLVYDPENPVGQSHKGRIFQSKFLRKQTTFDGQKIRWLYPDGTKVVINKKCEGKASSKVVTGEKDFMEAVTNEVSFKAGGGYGVVEGTAKGSASFKSVSEGTRKSHKSYVFTNMVCRLFKVSLDTYNMPDFDPGFVNAVESIRGETDWDSAAMTAFISSYGTHFRVAASMGSKYIESFVSSRENTQKLRSSTSSVSAGAEASAMGNSAGTEALNEKQKKMKENFDRLAERRKVFVIGADVPKSGYEDAQGMARVWMESTEKSNGLQMIGDFEFAGLDGIFAKANLKFINEQLVDRGFKVMTAQELAAVKANVEQAVKNSCRQQPSGDCAPLRDNIPLPAPLKVSPVPDSTQPMFGRGQGGPFELVPDVGGLFSQPNNQTADILISKVEVWQVLTGSGIDVISGLRVTFQDSQGITRISDLVGSDITSGTSWQRQQNRCVINIPRGVTVGSVIIRSGAWIDAITLMNGNNGGGEIGTCGNPNGGDPHTINIAAKDEIFNGFFGYAGMRIDKLGVKKAKILNRIKPSA